MIYFSFIDSTDNKLGQIIFSKKKKSLFNKFAHNEALFSCDFNRTTPRLLSCMAKISSRSRVQPTVVINEGKVVTWYQALRLTRLRPRRDDSKLSTVVNVNHTHAVSLRFKSVERNIIRGEELERYRKYYSLC